MNDTIATKKIGVSIALKEESSLCFWSARTFVDGHAKFIDGKVDGDLSCGAKDAMSKITQSAQGSSILIMDADSFSPEIANEIGRNAGAHRVSWIKSSSLPDAAQKSVRHANQLVAERIAEAVQRAAEAPEIQRAIGKASGKEMFKVRGFEMPYCGSPEDAISVYKRLKKAYETGYYTKTSEPAKRKP